MSVEHDENGQEVLVRPPAHPVPSLQGPFEESMVESVNDAAEIDIPLDAVTRRIILLDSVYYQRVVAGRWKQKPGEKYHPLWKLVAQMSFGLHLLARNMAKSSEEVMKILQAHVDDIDGFLERTAEDFDLALDDMQERLKCLRLPLQHGDIFDRMLEDRTFRASILEGNEKIEHIVRRTKRALKDALKDVQKGFDATNVLDKYLSNLTSQWARQSPEQEAVLVAMVGNVEGWRRAFMELHLQGNKLAGTLKKLTEVVGEMERRAAAVSRDIVAKSQMASNQATRSSSSLGSRAPPPQKPLPGPPGHRSSTRRSSRSTHLLDHSSKRNSVDGNFDSRPQSRDSPQAPSGRQTPNTTLATAIGASARNATDDSPRKSAMTAKASPIPEDWQNEIPVELPADIPEEVLRNAPVSAKNRLSMTLGLKPRDNADHRISSIYYPKALGDLLKLPQSPRYKASPQIVAARNTAVRSDSPLTESEADYFSAHERSPSIGHITPDTKKFLDSNLTTPDNAVPLRISVRSPTIPEETSQRQSSVPNSGLTSHSAVMQMASPPVELCAVGEAAEIVEPERPKSRSRQESQSTLGEPGPEIADIEDEADTFHQADIDIAVIPPVQNTTKSQVVHEIGDGTAPAPGEPAHQPITIDDEEDDRGRSLTERSVRTLRPEPERSSEEVTLNEDQQAKTDVLQPCGDAPAVEESANIPALTKDDHTVEVTQPTQNIDQPANDDTITTFIAELEAVAPQKASRPVTMLPPSPIELEAPVQTFVLPPRSKAKLSQGKDYSSATIKDRADFFKLPNEQIAGAETKMKPRDFRGPRLDDPGPVRPLKLKLQKFEGKLVPVQVHSPQPNDKPDSPRTSRLSQDVIANLIEQMSHTPKSSPTHSRAGSESSNSAQIRSKRSSRAFGPPDSAPAPPAPGGRSMINPDYASIGQFEGERKQHAKRSSRGSKASLKEILGGSRRNSSDSSVRQNSRVQSPAQGSDMLTSAGKDVLWFKEDGMAPVGVASSS